MTSFGVKCQKNCVEPPDECTGDPEIDAILKKSDLGCAVGLTEENNLYTWDGFCKAVREFNSIPGDKKFFLGDGSSC